MYVLQQFIDKLINQDVVQNGLSLDKTFLDVGKVVDFASGFEIIKGLDNTAINGSALVGLDTKTERKLQEQDTERMYSLVKHLKIKETQEFQQFEVSEGSGTSGSILSKTLSQVKLWDDELSNLNFDSIPIKDKPIKIEELQVYLKNELKAFELSFTFLKREVSELRKYLEQHKSNNSYFKELIDGFILDRTPVSWKNLMVAQYLELQVFFRQMVGSYNQWRRLNNANFKKFSLSGLNQPDALLVCLRQLTALRDKTEFEKLVAYVSNKEQGEYSFCMCNLTLNMFDQNGNSMIVPQTIENAKDELWITFVPTQEESWINIPIYLQKNRDIEVFDLWFEMGSNTKEFWLNRGVAVICDNN